MAERIVLAGVVALLITLIIGPAFVGFLRKLRVSQVVQKELPKEFRAKEGTPVMGGIIILTAVAMSTMAFSGGSVPVTWALLITLGYGLVGFIDDFIMSVARRPLGLTAGQKLVAQLVLAFALALYAYVTPGIGSLVLVPWGKGFVDLGVLFVPFTAIVVVVGTSNGVNLADGMDGLAAGTTGIAAIAFAVITYLSGHADLAIFAAAVAGSCLGFEWFNVHPAQVFMGDTGSLALGGALAAMAVLSRTEFYLIPIGGVFLVEVLSVVAQVSSYKLRNGKRVLRMAPIHYHFKLGGMHEAKVVFRFWAVGAGLAVLGVALFLRSGAGS